MRRSPAVLCAVRPFVAGKRQHAVTDLVAAEKQKLWGKVIGGF